MTRIHRRRLMTALFTLLFVVAGIVSQQDFSSLLPDAKSPSSAMLPALARLDKLEIKGRAPKTGYERAQFGDGWQKTDGCDTRNIILARDLEHEVVSDDCKVSSGILKDPYTGVMIAFKRGTDTSDDVQIDHVVALSDAWQKGAQQLSYAKREAFANDPLNLLAVDGEANQQKSDGDAATWLPPNKSFRCQYVIRQIDIKSKYHLWVSAAEKDVIRRVLTQCD